MPGEQTQTTQQQQTQNSNMSSASQPWAPTRSSLMDLLGRFSNLGSSGVPSATTGALSNLSDAAAALPNMGGDALAAIKNLFSPDSGGNGALTNGYSLLKKNIGNVAGGGELDPYTTPGFGDSIARMTNDITSKVKDVYNASGRDPSGAGSFAGSLGKGLTEGIAPIIQNQYNTNNANRMAAANKLFDASGAVSSGLNNSAMSAIQASGQLPGLFMQPAAAQFDAANKGSDLQWQNLSRWLQGTLPIAALGSETNSSGTTNSNGTSTRTTPESTLGNILGGAAGLTGLLGQTGAFAGAQGAGWLSTMLPMLAMSDERLKENIEEVGTTHDGQPLYQYNYKGDAIPRIGLMAQEVEKLRPDAVVEIGGFKAVDYGKATEKARRIGMMHDLLEAA